MRVPELEFLVPRVLTGAGMPPDQAQISTQVLIDSSLRGIDSHGVEKLPMYVRAFERGTLRADAALRVEDGGGPTASIDAGFGLGFVPAVRAVELVIDKASSHGVGAVSVRSSGHFGAGGYYVRQIAEAGMVGFISTNARPLLPAQGGTAPLVGNNPFAFGAPRAVGPAFVFDMACSVSAFGKVRRAVVAGEDVPEDWGFDADGARTRDPQAILDGGFLAPVGGYKGFNLAMMMEILSAALCGAAMGPLAGSVGEPNVEGCGHFVLALSPAHFGGGGIAASVDSWLSWMRESSPDLRIPGEAGVTIRAHRLKHGVPVPGSLAASFDAVARQQPLAHEQQDEIP